MTKEEMRKKYLHIRKNIINKYEIDKRIYEKVINNERIKSSECVLIYVSYNNEVDTLNIIDTLLKNKKVAVPKIENDKMNFYYINSLTDLKYGKYHILEPITNRKVVNFSNTVSITPGICFSKDGYRLGYGKGFYDRFYQEHHLYAIGLCYEACLLDKIITDKYDCKVNEIIF